MKKPLNFEFLKPFKTQNGDVILMYTLSTFRDGSQSVEDETHKPHKADDLRELTPDKLTELAAEEAYEEALVMAEAENKIN